MVLTRTGRSTRKTSIDNLQSIVLGETNETTEKVVKQKVVPEKTPVISREDVEEESDEDNDDVPMEVSSKNTLKPDIAIVEPEEEYVSIYDMVKQKQDEDENKKKEKTIKKRVKKNARKLAKGMYEVRQSKAKFRVTTLSEGIKQPLEPKFNFRDELLKSRTENVRMKNPGARIHREKWLTARL